MNELALFAGAGGGILGGKLLGWRTVCAVEWDPYARDVLVSRQNDGSLDPFPIWDDVQTFDGKPWRGSVDVVSGGFPCQDISAAGKGVGIEGERSGMWKHMARIVGEVRPRFVFVENSPMLVGRGLAVVLGDLAEMGYDARWGVMGADDAGAPHRRKRIWILADSGSFGSKAGIPKPEQREEGVAKESHHNGRGSSSKRMAYSRSERHGNQEEELRTGRNTVEQSGLDVADASGATTAGRSPGSSRRERTPGEDEESRASRNAYWIIEPELGRVAHGVACRVDRLRCIGNGQVPHVAALAWNILTEDIKCGGAPTPDHSR